MTGLTSDDLILVDEYVLGVLGEDATRSVEDRAAADPDLATALAGARERFLPLDDTAEAFAPSARLWQRIEARLTERGDGVAGAAGGMPAARPRRTRFPAGQTRRSPFGMRVAALSGIAASLILAAALAWVLILRPGPVVVAALMDDAGEIVALVESNPDNRVTVTLLDDVELGTNRVLQVWTKPDPDGPPVSMGIIQEVASKTLSLAGYPPPTDDQLYEITIEDAGGSATGVPTGPIVGKGFARSPF